MKAVVLTDNRNSSLLPETEHGLSVFLEMGAYSVLLDTGASDLCIRNAKKLGIELNDVDYVFISHGHADHIGGLSDFMEINKKARIVLAPQALSQRFFSSRKSFREIGVHILADQYPGRFITVDKDCFIEKDFQVIKPDKGSFPLPKANKHLFKDCMNGLEADDFDHELMACFGEQSLFVYCGCAHHGLLNILESIQVKTNKHLAAVFGGFHLLDSDEQYTYETEEELASITEMLKTSYNKSLFYTGHCTGSNVYKKLKQQLGDQLDAFHTGYQLNLDI